MFKLFSIQIAIFLIAFQFSYGQLVDDFSDGDFTNNPTWQGITANFTVNAAKQLQTNGPAATAIDYLVTNQSLTNDIVWEFYARCNFSPSTTNLARVYLISNQSDLTAALNGYYLQLGGETGNNDAIELYRQAGLTNQLVIRGINGRAARNNNIFRIKVTRSATGFWEIYSDSLGGTNYILEGTGTDNTYTTSNFFGVYCKHTTSTATSFYFDDFYVGPPILDTIPPRISNITVLSDSSLRINFSENFILPSGENILNYEVIPSISNPYLVNRPGGSFSQVELFFASKFIDSQSYQLIIKNIQDAALNSAPDTMSFVWYAPVVPQFNDVVINELLPDPTPVVGLPAQEFVEIFNRSTKVLDLAGWKITDGTTTATLGSYQLKPDSFLILCANTYVSLFSPFGSTLGLSSWPSLNNSSDTITIKDSNSNIIDVVSYQLSWYQDVSKQNGGWSLERIFPNGLCPGISNWRASIDPAGGTPGRTNSVLNQPLDVYPPNLLSSAISGNSVALIFNEAVDSVTAVNLLNYNINNGFGSPTNLSLSGDKTQLTLTYGSSFSVGVLYTLIINQIKDCLGNAQSNLSVILGIPEVVSVGDIRFNELLPDPDPVVGLPNQEFVELINVSGKLLDLGTLEIRDLSTGSFLTPMLLPPDSIVILCSPANVSLFSPFGRVCPTLSTLPSLNNSSDNFKLLDNFGNVIDSVAYQLSWYQDVSKQNGGWSLERIFPNGLCPGISNWRASIDPAGGTPGRTNSVLNQPLDVYPPNLLSSAISGNSVALIFNEAVDSVTAVNLLNYNINNGFGSPTNLSLSGDKTQLTLTYGSSFSVGVLYTLIINQIKDCLGNAQSNLSVILGIPEVVSVGDIRFNELLPDPDPVVGLPNQEFVELINVSGKLLDLGTLEIRDLSTGSFLTPMLLPPDSIVILCSPANVSLFSPFGRVCPTLSTLPSLNNSSDNFKLLDNFGNVIDSVSYQLSWYQDVSKQNGGWSLERIEPRNSCSGIGNWRASIDSAGGTPGKTNSVTGQFLDTSGPQLISYNLTSTYDTLTLYFNESIDFSSLSINQLNITPTIGSPTQILLIDAQTVSLVLLQPITSGIIYQLTVTNFKDCIGNLTNSQTISIGVPEQGLLRDVIFNELFPDPDPTQGLPEYEFVEIFNRSSKIISLAGWKLTDGSSTATINDFMLMPQQYLLIASSAVKQFFEPFGSTVGVSNFPSLNNSSDKLVLINNLGEIVDSVTYSDTWYQDNVKKDGGWTLERIDPNEFCHTTGNWIASNNSIGGTPGQQNSVIGSFIDTDIPQIKIIQTINNQEIIITFSENMNPDAIANPSLYFASPTLGNPMLITQLNDYQLLVRFSANIDSNFVYSIQINGQKDCSGNQAGTLRGEFFIPVAASAGDILLSEVLLSPPVGGQRHVELYNNSSKIISLFNWSLAKGDAITDSIISPKKLSNSDLIIRPGKYLCFSKDTAWTRSWFLPPDTAQFARAELPTYSDSKDKVYLLSADNQIIDKLNYTNSMHFGDLLNKRGVALERLDYSRPTNMSGNWFSASADVNFGTPGYRNSQKKPDNQSNTEVSLSPEVFSPDEDGFNDFLAIQLNFPTPGTVISIQIFDAEGRKIRKLANSVTISYEGEQVLWDGTDETGRKLSVGSYIFLVSAHNPTDGFHKEYKLTAVLAGKF
ncbi:MAG: lamin tail domain-containing protein [Bacteroidia bacterium]|nr:lamin tail domain-containing protein [Bacteroidia bacterium]